MYFMNVTKKVVDLDAVAATAFVRVEEADRAVLAAIHEGAEHQKIRLLREEREKLEALRLAMAETRRSAPQALIAEVEAGTYDPEGWNWTGRQAVAFVTGRAEAACRTCWREHGPTRSHDLPCAKCGDLYNNDGRGHCNECGAYTP